MTKKELQMKTDQAVGATKDALQMVYDALNQGQKKQLIKDEKVKALFDLYGVQYE